MDIPIDTDGSVQNSGKAGHRVRVQSDCEATGGFLVFQWWNGSMGPNGQASFDDWVEDAAALDAYFAESGWEINWGKQ